MLLLPGSCSVFGCMVGIVVGRLFQKPQLTYLLIGLVFLAFLACSVFRLYQEPQIFAYSMPFGFWPGSLYDEDIRVTRTLIVHRSLSVLIALSWVMALDGIMPLKNSGSRFLNLRLQRIILAGLFASSAGYLYSKGETYGFDLNRNSIDRTLSKHVNNKFFELRIDPSISKLQLENLVAEHELHHDTLSRFFDEKPQKPIRVYIYRGLEQKRRLMGAYQTQIARPWENEIHVHGFDVPHRVLKHELAHVFAAQFATGMFKVPSSKGIFINMGIVEGTAVAADWPAEQMTVHEWARAMRAQKRAPDPRHILYPQGFWAISASRAYTIAGSFLRFLIDKHGINAFKTLYASNDFSKAYGKSLDDLVTDWETFIDRRPLNDRALQLAEHRFTRPGIFKKVCAHETAKLADRAYKAIRSRDFDRGIPLIEEVQANRPNSAYNLVFLANALAEDGQFDRAKAVLTKAQALPHISAQSRSSVALTLADLEWRTKNSTKAWQIYRTAKMSKLPASQRRLLQAKIAVTRKPKEIQQVLMPYLLQTHSQGEALVRLGDLGRAHPEDGLTHYLYARQLERLQLCKKGLEETAAAVQQGLPSPDFYAEAAQMHGRMTICTKQFKAAQKHFQSLVDSSTRAVDQLKAQEWKKRAKIRALRAERTE